MSKEKRADPAKNCTVMTLERLSGSVVTLETSEGPWWRGKRSFAEKKKQLRYEFQLQTPEHVEEKNQKKACMYLTKRPWSSRGRSNATSLQKWPRKSFPLGIIVSLDQWHVFHPTECKSQIQFQIRNSVAWKRGRKRGRSFTFSLEAESVRGIPCGTAIPNTILTEDTNSTGKTDRIGLKILDFVKRLRYIDLAVPVKSVNIKVSNESLRLIDWFGTFLGKFPYGCGSRVRFRSECKVTQHNGIIQYIQILRWVMVVNVIKIKNVSRCVVDWKMKEVSENRT